MRAHTKTKYLINASSLLQLGDPLTVLCVFFHVLRSLSTSLLLIRFHLLVPLVEPFSFGSRIPSRLLLDIPSFGHDRYSLGRSSFECLIWELTFLDPS